MNGPLQARRNRWDNETRLHSYLADNPFLIRGGGTIMPTNFGMFHCACPCLRERALMMSDFRGGGRK